MRERRKKEFELLKQKYGEMDRGEGLDWAIFKVFPLPPGWAKTQIGLLVLVPPGYPMTPPDNFYVEPGLKLASGNLPQNYSEPVNHQGRSWGQFSFHIEQGWLAAADIFSGHNLLTFMLAVEKRLAEAS